MREFQPEVNRLAAGSLCSVWLLLRLAWCSPFTRHEKSTSFGVQDYKFTINSLQIHSIDSRLRLMRLNQGCFSTDSTGHEKTALITQGGLIFIIR